MTKPSTTTSTTPLPGGFQFIVTNGTQKCPSNFEDSLLGNWNVFRLQQNLKELKVKKVAEDFGQDAANNYTYNKEIVFQNYKLGFLNFTLVFQEQKNIVYEYPQKMVEKNEKNMPITKFGRHFSFNDWKFSRYFGVGCSAFIDLKNQTQLYIAMIFEVKIV